MQTLAKALVDDSTFANRTSEAEFTALCTEQVKRDYPKDGADVAFGKFFSDSVNTVIRQAHAMINAHPDRAHSYLQTSPLHKASYPPRRRRLVAKATYLKKPTRN